MDINVVSTSPARAYFMESHQGFGQGNRVAEYLIQAGWMVGDNGEKGVKWF